MFFIVFDIECLHIITLNLDTVFQSARKIGYFPKNATIIILDSSLQPYSLVKVLKAYIR